MIALVVALIGGVVIEMVYQTFEALLHMARVALTILWELVLIAWELLLLAASGIKWRIKTWNMKRRHAQL